MSKNIQVNLTFSADTGAAKAQLQQLQQQLTAISTMPMKANHTNIMRQDLAEATEKAVQLKIALNNATNVNTGKLNFNKFNQQLKSSNMSLEKYAQALKKLGPQGTEAFAQLATAIRQSEAPMIQLKGRVAALGKTLANTARWQISSSLLQGLTRTFSSTVEYAKELNESLNNIRIVTGKSTEEMSKFAKQANEAAKKLSATTTEYTNASLIYYQQGLDDKSVKERTETTLKLAKVVGEEAKTVSEWMTAIWNNFDNGSKQLEYYADVMAALGAATASSADEIAGGLEKFAAVAETVGLSYEYAASALATITAETRQSEDVVGTALKTIFARIEGLSLGETLEDGTTLNQYSEALFKVGVNIKDSNGNLKDMDSILDSIGSKWQHLNKDQQVALAQSVAGIRQYNQFIALMSNWDVMKENLEISKNATGELERQHVIYEEGIEGATARVKAQLEEIKNSLLDENDLLPLLDVADKFLTVISDLVKAFGGLPGILALVTSGLLKLYGPQVASGIQALTSNISIIGSSLSGQAAKDRSSAITQSSDLAANMAVESEMGHEESTFTSAYLKKNAELTKLEEENQDKLNSEYKSTLNMLRQILEIKQQIAIESSREIDSAEEQGEAAETALRTKLEDPENAIDEIRAAGMYEGRIAHIENTNYTSTDRLSADADQIYQTAEQALTGENATAEDARQLEALSKAKDDLIDKEAAYQQAKQKEQALSKKGTQLTEQEKAQLKDLAKETKKARDARNAAKKTFSDTARAVNVATKTEEKYGAESKETRQQVSDLIQAEKKAEEARKKKSDATKDADAIEKQYKDTLKEGTEVGQHWSMSFVKGVQGAATFASGLMMVTNAFTTLNESIANGTASFSTYLSFATSLLFGLGQLAPTFLNIGKAIKLVNTFMDANNLKGLKGVAIATTRVLIDKLGTKVQKEKIAAMKLEGVEQDKQNLKDMVKILFNIGEQASQGPKGWITAAISAALVAALIGVAIAVNAGNKAQNDKEEEEAKKTQKYANTVSEAYDKVRESYENLKKSLEDYNSAQEAIGKLQKGTLEWKQAIQEANQQVIELLDQYPQLAKYIDNIDGRLTISAEGQQALLAEQGQRVATLANIKTNANMQAKQARYEADKKAELTTTFDTAGGWEFIGHLMAGGIFSPGLGVADAIINNEREYQASEDAINALTKAYEEQGETIFEDLDQTFKELNITDPELIKALKSNKDSLEELVRTNKELIELEKIANQQKVDNLLYSQEHFISDNYGKGVQEAALKQYEQLKKDAVEKMGNADDYRYGKWYALGIAKGGTEQGKEAFKQYAELMGYDNAEATNFKGDRVVFKYKEGDDVKKDQEVSYKDMEEALAEASAAEQAHLLANSVNQMTSQVRILQNSTDSMDQAIGSFLENGDLSYLDPEVFDEIAKSNFKISEEQAKLFGYDSVDAASKAFKEAYDNYDAAIAKTNILAREQQAINTILADGAAELEQSETALRAYAESLTNSSEYLNENKEAAAKMAVQHYRTAIGVNELKKALNDNISVLEDSTASSLDYYEALGAVKDSLEKTFGVKVSASFVEKNLSKIKAVADNDTEALQDLRKELIQDFIINLSIDDEYKTALQNEITELMEMAENSPIGMEIEFDNSKAIEGINEALAAGAMTVEEVEAMFANANLAMPKYNTAKIPHTTTSNSKTTSVVDQWWGKQTITSESTTDTTTWSEIPYFGDNPPVYEKKKNGEYAKKSGTGVESSFKVTTMANKNTDQDILDYDGKGTAAGETKTEKDKRLSNLDKEIERYHEIDKTIEVLEQDFKRLSRAKNEAFGANKIALMQKEIDKQKEILALEEQRLNDAKNNYWNLDRNNILNKYNVVLDEDGNITNYKKLIQDEVDKLKNMSDPNSKSYKDQQAYLDQMKKDFSDYEKGLKDYQDSQDKVLEMQSQIKEMALEKIVFEIEFKIEMTEDDKALLEFLLNRMEDDAYSAAKKIENLSQQIALTVEQIGIYEDGIEEVNARLEAGDISPQQAMDQLRELRSNIIEATESLWEMRKAIVEGVSSAIEAFMDDMDRGVAKIEYYGSVLNNYKNIIDIVGKDMLGLSDENINALNSAIVTNANANIRAIKAEWDAAQSTLNNLRQKRQEAEERGDDQAVKEYDEMIKEMEDRTQDLGTSLQDALTTGLEAAADAFKDTVNQIADNFGKAVSGIYDSISEMREGWDKQLEVAERYLKTYEQTYELNKLNRQIQKSIDASDNVASQKQLRSLQKEMLSMSEDGQQLSKYDLEYLQKKYDLMVAEQALKEAQNAKSVVRLRRDSEGNYGYVYTADQNVTDQAQQNYEDKLYAYQQFSDKMDQELTEMYISAAEKRDEAIRNAAEMYGEGTEAFLAAEQRIMEEYDADLLYIQSEYGKITDRNLEINQKFSAGVAATYHDTYIYQIVPAYQSFGELYTETTNSSIGASDALKGAVETLRSTFQTQFGLAGEDFNTFASTANKKFGDIGNDSEDAASAVKNMADDMDRELNGPGGAIDKLEQFQIDYQKIFAALDTSTQGTINKVNELIAAYAALANTDTTPPKENLSGEGNPTDGDDGGSESSYIYGTNKKGAWDQGDIKVGNTTYHNINGKYYAADSSTRYDANNQDNIRFSSDATSYTAQDLFVNMGKDDYIKIDTRYANKKTIGDKVWYQLGSTDMWFDTSKASKEGDNIYKWRRGDHGVWYETSAGLKEWEATDTIQNNLERQKNIEATIKSYIANGGTTFSAKPRGNSKYNIYNDDLEATGEKIDVTEPMTVHANDIRWKKINGELKSFVYFDSDAYGSGYVRVSSIYPVSKNNTNQSVFSGFDTGGYTGSWGPEGRLALLHQKELVLNAHDTENILSAVSLIRDISQKLESRAMAIQYASIIDPCLNTAPTQGDTLQQEVTIHAEFPNATDHREIEEAFENLVNLASQYANRK